MTDTSHRKFKAYDANTGELVGFDTAIDLHQAIAFGHCNTTKPGEAPAPGMDPTKNYHAMNSEDLRKLCVAKNIIGYPVMTREQQCEALAEADKRDAAILAEGRGKTAGKKVAATTEKANEAKPGESVRNLA